MGIASYDSKKVVSSINSSDERKAYFEGIGVNVQNATSLETAIKLSGLDFEVERRQMMFQNEVETDLGNGNIVKVSQPMIVPNNFVNIRTDTLAPLGPVGKNYTILQNREAFDFLDDIGQDIKYETAGTYGPNGAKSFITIKTETIQICGDDFSPYIALLNSFDGSGSIKAFFTPVRVFCSNTLIRAMREGNNKVSIRHSTNLEIRMQQARELLLENTNYLAALKKEAEKLGTTPFSREAFEALAKELYPVNKDDAQIIQVRNMEQIAHLLEAYNQQDLNNFRETAWGAIQAVADAESHRLVFRNTEQRNMQNFKTVLVDGMPLLNHVYDMMLERVAA